MTALRRATYRVQLDAEFGFDQAAEIADYLAALGVSHLYTSPYLQAAPGSTHGYDVVDYGSISRDLGGEAGHARMIAALRAAGLGHLIDIVPNHMSVASRANRWWWDVLEHGITSRYARYFDVDWDSPEARLRNTILLPVLKDQYGRALERGEIRLHRAGGKYTIRYEDHEFPVDPRSLDGLDLDGAMDVETLHELLERQNYRLAWWKAAERDLGYRRFFDVNTLIGLAIENPGVFEDTHRLVLRLVGAGQADGLRVDHPDGLQDPEDYLERLRAACPCYVVVEKILAPGEWLPTTWPVAGTTGYDFLTLVGGLFIDSDAEAAFTQGYATFTGTTESYESVARDKKLLVLREGLGSDVNRLAELLLKVCERHRRYRDYTRHLVTEGIRELLACLPVYRTYVRPTSAGGYVSDTDRRTILDAAETAKRRRSDLDGELFDFLRALLTLETRGDLESLFVSRFQQLSTAAMAKGVEDTAFYCYNRFVALNDVGGDPSRFGVSPQQFHDRMREVQRRCPETMVATATHDAKRGEDVRARLAVISECPDHWLKQVGQWSKQNEPYRTGDLPDRNTEYLFYQTLVGAWPLAADRALPYMEKATREAKTHTSWTAPREEFESALRRFVEQSLADPAFTRSVAAYVDTVLAQGRVVSLAQTLIKLTAPGIPDLYQGTELWSLTLVDPDNRRPVDFALRRRLLEDARDASAEQVMARMDDGLPKLWLIARTLAVRAAHSKAFGPSPDGCYRPLAAAGPRADHVLAFSRGGRVVTAVPRLTLALGGDWQGTALTLPAGRWRNTFTGEEHGDRAPVAELFLRFPVALLVREDA